ncbi:MAG: hypothetical protein KAR06_09005 [Deltaproteobacteria bacterium]|nr:hypothetical protein [Deltaproteobacteria bacterium]
MTVDWYIFATIATPIVTLFIGALLNRAIENRPKLITHYGHVSGFSSINRNGEPLQVNTHSVIIANIGRKSAKNIRVAHSYLTDFSVYPDVQYELKDLPRGGKEIIFPALIPKGEISITYLYFPPTTYDQIMTRIESDEGAAKIIDVLQVPKLSKATTALIWFLIIMGSVSTVYILFMLARYLIKMYA